MSDTQLRVESKESVAKLVHVDEAVVVLVECEEELAYVVLVVGGAEASVELAK